MSTIKKLGKLSQLVEAERALKVCHTVIVSQFHHFIVPGSQGFPRPEIGVDAMVAEPLQPIIHIV